MNYLKYYDAERYLFEDVHSQFHANGYLIAFDFFTIVIWKANRAKSNIARKLVKMAPKHKRDLGAIAMELTSNLYRAADAKERLRILMKDWNFALPMASAILTVLWPSEFTVYDYRVRHQIDSQQDLTTLTDFEKIWAGYLEYMRKTRKLIPRNQRLTLRDQDRYLWAKSAAEQLEKDIQSCFAKQ